MFKYYSKALLITYNVEPEDENKLWHQIRELVAKIERDMFLDSFYKAFGMGAGPCHLCEKCDVTKPCKHPYEARPSMEACGIDVYQTVRNVGLNLEVVKSYEMPCTYCGLIVIE